MEKLIAKFANPFWSLKIVVFTMGILAVHFRYLSAYMGK